MGGSKNLNPRFHQNLLNPMSINRNPPCAIKCTSTEQKLIIEIQRNPQNPPTNQIKSNQDLYSAICSRGFRGAWRMDYV